MDDRIELLFEQPGLPAFRIPETLAASYGGDLGFQPPRVFANFVASVDGVVSIPGPGESGGVISKGSKADRFVMGLLRACADVVMVGASTFRKAPGHLWTAEHVFPPAAEGYAALRRKLGLQARPRFVVVSASGELDTSQPALRDDALIVRGRQPKLADVLSKLQADGARLVLTEGGPTLAGQLAAEGLLDELFLTTSPFLFGRRRGDDRKSLLEGVDLAPLGGAPLELLSARRQGAYLFLRYALEKGDLKTR
jgi:riboflavin biosynthesis pyrimidine reductase